MLFRDKATDAMILTNDDIAFETGIDGVKFDFNYGCRVKFPDDTYSVGFVDLDSGSPLEAEYFPDNVVSTKAKYFVRIGIRIFQNGILVWSYDYDAAGKNVRIELLMADRLGDLVLFFPYMEKFQEKHQCNIYITTTQKYVDIIERNFKKFHVVAIDTLDDFDATIMERLPEKFYATYYYRTGYPDIGFRRNDIRKIGMHKNAAEILGLDVIDGYKHKLLPTDKAKCQREIIEPYVCISLRSSNTCKEWNNVDGWQKVVRYLRDVGYRVFCIDGDPIENDIHYAGIIDNGCELRIGYEPLQDRVDFLYHADFLIGLSSGLSWLAWGTGVPVIMISGFSLPYTEFENPYRIINNSVCHGCWNNTNFDGQVMYNGCPFYEGTERTFECSTSITGEMVIEVIKKLMADYKLNPQLGTVRKIDKL